MIFDLRSSDLRLILRLYFLIALNGSAIIGDNALERKSKVALLENKTVSLPNMTGWVNGLKFFWTWSKIRTIPGGVRLGSLMGVTAILTLIADLLVSYLVYSTPVVTTCSFGQGLVVATQGPFLWTSPPANGRPYYAAMNAQSASYYNGGVYGIYDKLNTDPRFYADDSDLLSGWSCAQVGSGNEYAAGTPLTDVEDDLISRQLMFQQVGAGYSSANNGSYDHLVLWSVDFQANGNSQAIFAVDQTVDTTAAITLFSYTCQIKNDAVDLILESIDTSLLLPTWSPYLQGGCYDGSFTPPIANITAFLEQFLNTIVMVQGGSNDLLRYPPLRENIQGCVVLETYMSPAVLVIVVVAALVAISTVGCWIVSALQLQLRVHGKDDGVIKSTPSGTTGWMVQAVRESTMPSVHELLAHPQDPDTGVAGHEGYHMPVENMVREAKELQNWGCRRDSRSLLRLVRKRL